MPTLLAREPIDRESGIIKLLSACIRAGMISGVHASAEPRPDEVGKRTKSKLLAQASSPLGLRRAKLAADVLGALETQRRVTGVLHA